MVVSKIDPFKEEDTPLRQPNPLDMLDKVEKSYRDSSQARNIQQILQNQDATSRGINLVADALSRAGQTVSFAKSFDQKVKSELEKEFTELASSVQEDLDDKALLSRVAAALQRKQELKGQQEKAEIGTGKGLLMDEETSNLLQLYLRAYGQLIATDSALIKKKVDEMEKSLLARGFSHSHLLSLRLSLKASLRGEIVEQIKEAFVKRALSTDMIVEWATNTRSLNDILDTVWTNEQLGGKEFGGYRTDLQGAMDHVVDESNKDLRVFLNEVLKAKMTEKLIGKNEQITQELKNLLQIAGRIGFDLDEYIAQWQKDKINEGLFIFQPPPADLLKAQADAHQQQQQQQSQKETTEEFLVNRLRALYMRKALKNDWFTSIDTQFKIRRIKNGMRRLGIYSNDLNNIDEQVKSEALTIARMKIMEMIKEALLERATLYRLEGPAFTLLNTKMVGLMRNAKRLGLSITQHDFELLRDKANYRVFEVSKRELRLTIIAAKATGAPYLNTKKQKLIKLLNRLKEESKIQEDLGISDDDQKDSVALSA
ncbi:MAG: hypothetical protein KKA19_01770 [Candidatus Margulisbacteria bacterium]|nr:hypothetical protein [Candidatus Margulisiibacteriota bacterium]